MQEKKRKERNMKIGTEEEACRQKRRLHVHTHFPTHGEKKRKENLGGNI